MCTEKDIRKVIYQSCDRLDRSDYKSFFELCAPGFTYRITTYSPEIRRDMLWLEKDRKGFEELVTMLPRHNYDRTPMTRHTSLLDVEEEEGQALAISGLQVFRTETDGGTTSLYAVGKYFDRFDTSGDQPILISREVRLDTRQLGIGYHVPL